MGNWKKLLRRERAGRRSEVTCRYRLECKRCGRVFNGGVNAGIMSMEEGVEISAGRMVTVFGDDRVVSQPDMVVSFKDHPPEDLEHSRQAALDSMKRIEASLRGGCKRKWYCCECGNDDKPYDYPPRLKEECPHPGGRQERRPVAPSPLPDASDAERATILAGDSSAKTRYSVNTYSAWRERPLANDPQRIRRMARKHDLAAFVAMLSADALSGDGLDDFFESHPPRDGEFLILWPRDLSEFSRHISRRDQDPFLMTNLRLAVFDAMKLVDVLDIETIDRFERKGISGKTVEITTTQGKTITVPRALTGEFVPLILEELRQRTDDS